MDLAEVIGDSSNNDQNNTDDLESFYLWEQGLTKTWDKLVETNKGICDLDEIDINDEEDEKCIEEILQNKDIVKRGILRNIVFIMDMTSSMTELDFKPNRVQFMVRSFERFLKDLLNDNPLTQVSIVIVRETIGKVIVRYSSNFEEIMGLLSNAIKQGCKGSMSLQNALDTAKILLLSIPPYGTKEIIFFLGSMRTADTMDVSEWIGDFTNNNILVNSVLFIPELYIIKTISNKTNGICVTALSNNHFVQLLYKYFLKPPVYDSSVNIQANIVPMGFPMYTNNNGYPIFCSCHKDIVKEGYQCPRCKMIVCSTPIKCPVCCIFLASPNHLSKSYTYIFPKPVFERIFESSICSYCKSETLIKRTFTCKECRSLMCFECCKYIYFDLCLCPGCNGEMETIDDLKD